MGDIRRWIITAILIYFIRLSPAVALQKIRMVYVDNKIEGEGATYGAIPMAIEKYFKDHENETLIDPQQLE